MSEKTSSTSSTSSLNTVLRVPTRRYFRTMQQGLLQVAPPAAKPPGLLSAKDFFQQMLQPNRLVNPNRQPSRMERETVESAMRSFQWE